MCPSACGSANGAPIGGGGCTILGYVVYKITTMVGFLSMTKRSTKLVVAFLAAASTALPFTARADEGADGKETWYVVRFDGTPVGIGMDLWRFENNEYYYQTYFEMRAARLGEPFQMVSQSEEWDDPDGKLIRFRSEINMDDTRMQVQGRMQDNTIHLTTEGHRFADESTVEWEDGALGGGAVDRHVTSRLKNGESDFSVKIFDAQNGGFHTSRFVVRDTVTESIDDQDVALYRVDQFDDGSPVPYMTFWLDGQHDVRKMTLKQMGGEIVIEVVDKEAVDALELDPNFDIIRGSMIGCEGFPKAHDRLESVTYRLSFSAPIDARVLDGPNQEVIEAADGVVTLRVSRAAISAEEASADELAPYLEPDRYIQSQHADIVAIADSLQASGATGLQLAEDIAQWVNAYIVHKNFGQGFASAVDILDSKEGDCTEHSVLLAAVLRAAGFPARVAVGLAYNDGSLVGHMWTEVYVDGWHTLDALDLSASPVRIRLSVSRDQRALGESGLVNAYSIVGGLEAEVVEYSPPNP